ncbi:MAG: hypothetical protein AVDCRST_MAG44-1581, partial [uncultured Sphingomonas sp.]
EDALDPAALAGDADRLVTPCRERAAGGDGAADLAAAGHDHCDGRHLAGPAGSSGAGRGRRLVAASCQEEQQRKRRNHCRRSDHQHAPAARTVDHDQRIGGAECRFPVHHSLPNSV